MKAAFDRKLLVLLAVVAAVNLAWMPRELYPGDPFAMREEARSLLLHGSLALEPETAARYGESGQYVVRNERDGRYYSKYGVMSGLLFAVPLAVERIVTGELPPVYSENRVLYLNLFHWYLGLLLAVLLYRIAGAFGAAGWARVGFVLLVFYSGFLWNYLRAQTSELFQILLFTAAYAVFLDILRRRRETGGDAAARLPLLWGALAALMLTKVSYLLVGPLFGLGLAVGRGLAARPGAGAARSVSGAFRRWWNAGWTEVRLHLAPGLAAVLLLLAVNHLKFGSPWLTGYHAWRPAEHSFHADVLPDALHDLLFSVQWGLFFTFPLLLFALPWAPRWLKRHPVEYGTLAAVFAVYLVMIGALPIWKGEMGYGPRYFLFVLPLLALPVLGGLQALAERWTSWKVRLAAVAAAAALGYSLFLQVQVNRFHFMAFYRVRPPAGGKTTSACAAWFAENSYGRVVYDLHGNLDRLGWWRDMKASVLSPRDVRDYETHVAGQLAYTNSYWLYMWRLHRLLNAPEAGEPDGAPVPAAGGG